MAKKPKSNSKSAANKANGNGASDSVGEKEENRAQKKCTEVGKSHNASDSDDSSSSDDDSLVLEGVLIRNPDVSDSEDAELSSEEEDGKEPTKKKAKKSNLKSDATISKGKSNTTDITKSNNKEQKSQSQRKKITNEPEIIQVEFLFCDMNEIFFHGIKTLLHRHGVHAPHSTQLADLIIENEMVGTVLSTDVDSNESGNAATAKISQKKKSPPEKSKSHGNAAAASVPPPAPEEANVFGFASIVNLTTNHSSSCIQSLKSLCLTHCPSQHRTEMETVLSGKTRRPAGFFFHERMVNVPLEITEVLHQQLVLDMDYAVEHADDEAERKSLDFGAFVRLAPCRKGEGGGANNVIYKYFDDEVFATCAEFVYTFEIPKTHEGDEEEMWCSIIVLTKTGHRGAMKELKKMIHVN
mmetsp:Transcript_50389/g.107311  ORF Transcript_50389/g.107311 Transcript_50389/m.107311 type:complete len:411 (+) Transcript_50389:38-1270(+)